MIEAEGLTMEGIARLPAPRWPKPMDRAAYHGIVGEVVDAIEPYTEADANALMVETLGAFGCHMGRGPHAVADGARHGTNIYGVIVGESGHSRKGSADARVRELMLRVDPLFVSNNMKSGLSSGEGLAENVKDLEPSEDDEETQVNDDKRRMVVETEFSRTLKVMAREGNILSDVAKGLWDTGDAHSLTKHNPIDVTGAHITIFGQIVKKELLKRLQDTEAANGFGNRFLWCCAERSKELANGKSGDPYGGMLVPRVHDALKRASTLGFIQRDEAAKEMWVGLYHELTKGHAGLWGDLTNRAEAQVLRLSVIYAALDGSALIKPVHLEAATAVWDYADESVRCIFGEATGNPIADRIHEQLRFTGSMARTDISALFGNNKSMADIGRALSLLVQQDSINATSVPGENGGRPVEVWTLKSDG